MSAHFGITPVFGRMIGPGLGESFAINDPLLAKLPITLGAWPNCSQQQINNPSPKMALALKHKQVPILIDPGPISGKTAVEP